MPAVAIPLLSYQPALDGFGIEFGEMHFGDLDWNLHLAAEQREHRLLWRRPPADEEEASGVAGFDPPLAFVVQLKRPDATSVYDRLLPALTALHLFGSGSVPIREAWVFTATGDDVEDVIQLPIQSRDPFAEFNLPAGVTSDDIQSAFADTTRAVATMPSLRATEEHFLLAVQRSDVTAGLVVTAIALESLIGSQQELSFRFSHQLARLLCRDPFELAEHQALLSELYNFRSLHVHGNRDRKYNTLRSRLSGTDWPKLEGILRKCVAYAIEYHCSERKTAWNAHLDNLLLGVEQNLIVNRGTDG